jgi:hypothetical protein
MKSGFIFSSIKADCNLFLWVPLSWCAGRMDYSDLARQLSLFRPRPSVKQKVHEESARQKSDSRNQDPANPIPQKSGCHNTKIDWSSYDPFDDEAYRKHQEKRRSKREHGKNAGKKHGSQQATALSREVGCGARTTSLSRCQTDPFLRRLQPQPGQYSFLLANSPGVVVSWVALYSTVSAHLKLAPSLN